jgi:hypothetical protein
MFAETLFSSHFAGFIAYQPKRSFRLKIMRSASFVFQPLAILTKPDPPNLNSPAWLKCENFSR